MHTTLMVLKWSGLSLLWTVQYALALVGTVVLAVAQAIKFLGIGGMLCLIFLIPGILILPIYLLARAPRKRSHNFGPAYALMWRPLFVGSGA